MSDWSRSMYASFAILYNNALYFHTESSILTNWVLSPSKYVWGGLAGLQMFHNLLKQFRKVYEKRPMLRKLLKVHNTSRCIVALCTKWLQNAICLLLTRINAEKCIFDKPLRLYRSIY